MISARQFGDQFLAKLVLSPTVVIALVFIYGFIFLTGWLSFTDSKLLPRWELAGWLQYEALFRTDRWWVSWKNLAIFGPSLVLGSAAIGLFLAILLDQKIRAEGFLRSIYLYPLALSFIVTGTAWKWILNPGIGVEKIVRDWGFPNFTFDWIVNPDFAIYTVVIAGLWQSSGFAMALFLAGLRGVDAELYKAAQVDGAKLVTIYWRIVIPSMRPVFFSVVMILTHIAVKSFDLVMALTSGGPGTATDVPAIFMYQFSFNRGQLGLGAASAMMMLMTLVAVLVPMIYLETRRKT